MNTKRRQDGEDTAIMPPECKTKGRPKDNRKMPTVEKEAK